MKKVLFPLALAVALATATLAACTAIGELTDKLPPFATRYQVEMSALAGSRTSAAMLLEAGVISADQAQTTLDTTDQLALALQLARTLQSPGPNPQLDALTAADERARARLVAAIAAAGG